MENNERQSKLVVGLMSGTSVDGIDACLVRINPDFSIKVINELVLEYPDNIKEKIFSLFNDKIDTYTLCWMNFILGEYFAQATLDVIGKAGLKASDVDLIGSHGQTIYHLPVADEVNGFKKSSTLQIGEPSIIAERTGITTIADFRPRDMAAGGQGAPLVCYADEIFFKKYNSPIAVQNIGGMSNVTVVSPECETFAFDTGPGNVLIDYYVNKFFKMEYDKDGLIASQGNVDEQLLDYLMRHSYYCQEPPKTTGREMFSAEYAEEILKQTQQNAYDVVATVTALTAKTIYQSYIDFVFPKTRIQEVILGGGGAYNLELLKYLKLYFGNNVKLSSHEDYGISNKFKEAIAFAFLAYTTYYGISNNVPSCTGANHKRILGKIIPGV